MGEWKRAPSPQRKKKLDKETGTRKLKENPGSGEDDTNERYNRASLSQKGLSSGKIERGRTKAASAGPG